MGNEQSTEKGEKHARRNYQNDADVIKCIFMFIYKLTTVVYFTLPAYCNMTNLETFCIILQVIAVMMPIYYLKEECTDADRDLASASWDLILSKCFVL